jgi:hypothetical protein
VEQARTPFKRFVSRRVSSEPPAEADQNRTNSEIGSAKVARVQKSLRERAMPTKKCEVKSALLREYMAALEKLKVAQQEHKQILAAGTGEGVVLRSRQRIEAFKRLCSTARVKYSDHCHAHRC